MTKHGQPTGHISDQVIRLCTSGESVSSLLAEDPTLAPGDAWKKLYGEHALNAAAKGAHNNEAESSDQDELERAARCGNWGPMQPSDLFLKVWTNEQ